MALFSFNGKYPKVADDAFVNPHAFVVGDVEIGSESSVWPHAVLRGDAGCIKVGRRSNLQDCVVVHTKDDGLTYIGNGVSIGHSAILHGCKLGDNILVGMGSILLDGVRVEDWVLIGAGALVPPNTVIPSRSLFLGVPGRVTRKLNEQDISYIGMNAEEYVGLASKYRP